MKELTKNRPKPLIEINKKPIIDYLINSLLLKQEVNNIYVIYGYLKNKWEEYISSYKSKNIIFKYDSQPINLINSFFKVAKFIKEEIIVVISGDMVFDFEIFINALSYHKVSNNDVSVALNKSSQNNYKCWDYVVSNETIVDIRHDSKSTNIERYFFIINKKVLEEFTVNFSKNMGDTVEEFRNYSEYNFGWSCLIKKLIDIDKYEIKAVYFDVPVVNVNEPEDLKKAELILNKKI